MPASQAHVATERASRYLAQLCEHARKMSDPGSHRSRGHRRHGDGGEPPVARHVEWSQTSAVIDFGWGRCTLRASGSELALSVEAGDEQHLQRVQDAIAGRLEAIGRRDRLTVAWNQAGPAGRDRLDAAPIVEALMTPEERADP